MAQSQNTIREIILGNAVATETTLDAFSASATAGEIGVFTQDGTAIAAGKPFVFAQKTEDSVFVSDVIFPDKVKSIRANQDAPAVQKVVTVSDISVEVGADYILDVRIYEHGSLSIEDYYIKHGAYRAVTGDTAEDIVDGLIASLNRNFSREPNATASSNPYFTFAKTGTGATAALTVTGKDQDYVAGKKEGRPVNFEVVARFDPATATVATTTAYSPGQGTGKDVAALEHDLRKNRGDLYGPIGYPNNYATIARADSTAGYNMLDIVHWRGHDGWNDVKMRKVTTVAITEALSAGIDAIIGNVETLTGITVGAFGEI